MHQKGEDCNEAAGDLSPNMAPSLLDTTKSTDSEPQSEIILFFFHGTFQPAVPYGETESTHQNLEPTGNDRM